MSGHLNNGLERLPLEIFSAHIVSVLDPGSCWCLSLVSNHFAHLVAGLDEAHGRLPAFICMDAQDLPRSLRADAVLSVRCSCTRICGQWSLFTREMMFEVRSLLVEVTAHHSVRAMVGFARCRDCDPVRVMAKRMYTGDFWVATVDPGETFIMCVPYEDFEANVFLELELFALHGGDLPVYVGNL